MNNRAASKSAERQGGEAVLSEHSLPVKAMTASFEKTSEKTVEQSAAKHAASQGGLLPCLHEIQAELGYIPNQHLESIATAFSLSTAEVHGVVSFITTLERHPLLGRVFRFAVPKPVRHQDHANWRLALPMFWVLSLMQRTQPITTASSECIVWVIVPAVPRFALMTTCMDALTSQACLS